jgi:hypothetical protein
VSPTPATVIDMGSPSALAVHALRTFLVASLVPTVLFYTTVSTVNLTAAVAVAITWYYGVLATRYVRGRPIAGAAALGAGLMTFRAVVVFWTGSTFLYFIQPVAGTVATATSFALTALAGRPLLERLAHDVVPVPSDLSARLRKTRFFDYTSALWVLTYVINAAGTVWLLTTSSLGSFLLMKSLLSPALTGTTIAVTYLLFRRWMRREGVHLRWHREALPVG